MEQKTLGYGIIGTGTYCDHYLGTLGPVYKNVRAIGCSDLNAEAATTEEMLADPEVDIVLIITNPASHYSLTMQALKAGKHVFCEKPLTPSLEQANEIVAFAAEKGLFVGAAPDTFLSPEFQTVRKLLDEGAIGKVISVTANYVGPGADLWHPNAGYLYKKGVGPALDMGPYFLTTLVSILGPLESLFCYANRGWDVRRIRDQNVEVEALTNYCGVLRFADLRHRGRSHRTRPEHHDGSHPPAEGGGLQKACQLQGRQHGRAPRCHLRPGEHGALYRDRDDCPPHRQPARRGRGRHGPGHPRGRQAPCQRRALPPCDRGDQRLRHQRANRFTLPDDHYV